MSIKVTPAARGRPSARATVAIGTFDGVHVGHRQVIEGADTVLTFEPHPLSVIHPEAAPKLIMPFEIKRDVIDGPRRRRAGRDPLRPATSPRSRPRSSARGSWSRRSAPSGSRSARTSASASGPRATRRCSRAADEFETRVVPLIEVDGETVSSTRIRAQVAAGDVEGAMRCLGAPFLLEGDGGRRRQARPHARLPDREPGPRRRARLPRPRRLRGVRERRSRPRSTSACGRPSRPGAGC